MTATATIYLNACSHGLPDRACAEAIARQARNPSGRRDEEVALRENARRACAAFLSSAAPSLAMGNGTFQLWSSAMDRLPPRSGRILVAEHEWGDNVRWLRRLSAKSGMTIDVIRGKRGAPPDVSAWAARMDEDVRALCLPLVTSIDGLCYPAREIASITRPKDALVVLDVAQALGRVSIVPDDMNCDVVVGTARKWLRGPRQTAMMWLSTRAERVLGCDARTLEPFDLNLALLAGLSRALELSSDVITIADRVSQLDNQLRDGLNGAKMIKLSSVGYVGTVICLVRAAAKPVLEKKLRAEGIIVKWCDAEWDEPLANHGKSSERLRMSPHIYNSPADIESAVNAICTA